MVPVTRSNNEGRHVRQETVFPTHRRNRTGLAVLVGNSDPWFAQSLLAGASAAGLSQTGSDCGGNPRLGRHWPGAFPEMVAHFGGGQVQFHFLDPLALSQDVTAVFRDTDHRWTMVQLNDTAACRRAVGDLVEARINTRLLLVLTGPGGFLVYSCPDAAAAAELVGRMPECAAGAGVLPAGDPELAMAAAGVAISEVTISPGGGQSEPELIAFYSLHQRQRTSAPEAFRDQVAEVIAATEPRITFAHRRLYIIGAGGLANPFCFALAGESPELRIWDGDSRVEPSNLNRQFLLTEGLGSGRPKAEVLVDALHRLDEQGKYEAECRFVREPEDLSFLNAARPDALVCLPDNDATRLLCGDAAREAGVPCATAGSSALSAQINVATPRSACIRCQLGNHSPGAGGSCALVEQDSIVGTNMVAAGLAISELREVLSGRPSRNVRFLADARGGNRLTKMLTNPPCSHRETSATQGVTATTPGRV